MKSENWITPKIQELELNSKDLLDQIFFLKSDHHFSKVTTKTPELAILYVKECEAAIYDTYGGDAWSDSDTWGWWNWINQIQIIDKSEIDGDIFDLDNYDFSYCNYPPLYKESTI